MFNRILKVVAPLILIASVAVAAQAQVAEVEDPGFSPTQVRPSPVIGVLGIEIADNTNHVLRIYKNSDALFRGIRVGDIILAADGHREVSPKIQKYTTGPANTEVTLTVKRGDLIWNVQVTRRPLALFQYQDRRFEQFNRK